MSLNSRVVNSYSKYFIKFVFANSVTDAIRYSYRSINKARDEIGSLVHLIDLFPASCNTTLHPQVLRRSSYGKLCPHTL